MLKKWAFYWLILLLGIKRRNKLFCVHVFQRPVYAFTFTKKASFMLCLSLLVSPMWVIANLLSINRPKDKKKETTNKKLYARMPIEESVFDCVFVCVCVWVSACVGVFMCVWVCVNVKEKSILFLFCFTQFVLYVCFTLCIALNIRRK